MLNFLRKSAQAILFSSLLAAGFPALAENAKPREGRIYQEPIEVIPEQVPEEDSLHIEFTSSYIPDSQSFLSKEMVKQNTASLVDLLNLSLNQLPTIKGKDPLSFGARLLLLGSVGYLHAVAAAQSHEFGHLTDAFNKGLRVSYHPGKAGLAGNISHDDNLDELMAFANSEENCIPFSSEHDQYGGTDYCVRYTDVPFQLEPNPQWVLPREWMGEMAAGVIMDTEIAGTLLRDRLTGKPPALTGLAYSIFHLGYAAYVLGWHLPYDNFGRVYVGNSLDDFLSYNSYSFTNKYLPYRADDPRWDQMEVDENTLREFFDGEYHDFPAYRPSGRQAKIIYAQKQLRNAGNSALKNNLKIKDYNIFATAVASLADPYLHASVASVFRYLFTGEDSINLPAMYIPRIVGRIGVPRPQYGLEWNVPMSEQTSLRTGTYFALDEEISFSTFFELSQLSLVRMMHQQSLTLTFGAEFIAQEEGSRYFSNLALGTALKAQLNIPVMENAGITVGTRYKSSEIWSPAFEGLREQIALMLGMYMKL